MYFKFDFGSNRLLLCGGLLRGYWKKSLNPFYLEDLQSDRNFQVIKVALQVLGWVINIPKIVDSTSVFSLQDFFNSTLEWLFRELLLQFFFFLHPPTGVLFTRNKLHKEKYLMLYEMPGISVLISSWWSGMGQVSVPHPALGVSATEPCSQCPVPLVMISGYIHVHDVVAFIFL